MLSSIKRRLDEVLEAVAVDSEYKCDAVKVWKGKF